MNTMDTNNYLAIITVSDRDDVSIYAVLSREVAEMLVSAATEAVDLTAGKGGVNDLVTAIVDVNDEIDDICDQLEDAEMTKGAIAQVIAYINAA